jgi:hypothetical protein
MTVNDRSGDGTASGFWGGSGALPPELNRAVPRPVRLTVTGKIVAAAAILSVLEAFVFGAWLYRIGQRQQQEASEFRRMAVKTTGRITKFHRGGKGRLRYHYQFEAEGKSYAGSFSTSRRAYAIGEPIEVNYLPGRPESNWATGHQVTGVPPYLGPIVAAMSLAVAAILGLSLRSQRRLLEEGRAAIATVLRVEPIRLKGVRYRVHYEFPLLSGARQTGRFDLPRDPAPAPGTPIVVIYDPDNPRRQRRYPFPLVRVSQD